MGVSTFADGTLGNISADDNVSLIEPEDVENYNNFGFSYEDMLNNPDYFIKNDSDISLMSTNTITLNYSKISVEEGESFTLRATVSDSGASVTWSSNNSMITVNSSGIVTGLKAGSATITATCLFSDNTTKTATCTVYVYIANGVYYIKNKNSNLRLEVYNGLIHQNTNVIQYSNRSASLISGLRQMWKVYFLGNGKYSVRAYHKLNMGLNVTGSNVDIVDCGVFDGGAYIPDSAEWNIIGESSAEYIIQNGSSNKTLCILNSSFSINASAIVGTYLNTNNCKWTFEMISSPPVGVLLYDTVTGSALINGKANKVVPVGYTISPEDMNISVSTYGFSSIVQNVFWSVKPAPDILQQDSYIELDTSTGEVTGKKSGLEVTIQAYRSLDDGERIIFEYNLYAVPYENGEWENAQIVLVSDIELEPQPLSNWCWLASARMFAKYYFPNLTATLEDAFGFLTGVEVDPNETESNQESNIINIPGSLAQTENAIIFYAYSASAQNQLNLRTSTKKLYSKENLIRFINDGHVVLISRGQYNAEGQRIGGHVTLIYGYVKIGDEYRFLMKDPAPPSAGCTRLYSYEKLCNGLNRQADESVEGSNNAYYMWEDTITMNTSYSSDTIDFQIN